MVMNADKIHQAKKNKADEYFTLLPDIIDELKYYRNQFKNKVVYLPCDNPNQSQFYYYFYNKFKKLGLKKLICSYYSSMNLFGMYVNKPMITVVNQDKKVSTKILKGNGDFRSKELISYWKEADIIVTNPPFSLFREFIDTLAWYKKYFLIIGNVNAISYNNVFRLFKSNQMICGYRQKKYMEFLVPNPQDYQDLNSHVRRKDNQVFVTINGITWFTNLEKKSPKFIKNNIEYEQTKYQKFSNFNAININSIKEIPDDYQGMMGVPITFMLKWNPKQYKIVRHMYGNDGDRLRIGNEYPYCRIIIQRR